MQIPKYANHNGHIYYVICKTEKIKKHLTKYLLNSNVQVNSHYQALHLSPFYKKNFKNIKLHSAEQISKKLLRLPINHFMDFQKINYVVRKIDGESAVYCANDFSVEIDTFFGILGASVYVGRCFIRRNS